jgi:hypothetical protein
MRFDFFCVVIFSTCGAVATHRESTHAEIPRERESVEK